MLQLKVAKYHEIESECHHCVAKHDMQVVIEGVVFNLIQEVSSQRVGVRVRHCIVGNYDCEVDEEREELVLHVDTLELLKLRVHYCLDALDLENRRVAWLVG